MIDVNNVLYLLDMSGVPIRALHDDDNTQVEEVDGSHSTLITDIPYDPNIVTEMQIIWDNERYIIRNIKNSRDGRLITTIEAEIAYMRLSNMYREIDRESATIETIAKDAVEDSVWTVGAIPRGLGGRHTLKQDKLESSTLKTLRTLERWSDGELKLQFDTLNYRINFVRAVDLDVGFLFKYRKNISGISKHIEAPKATVIIPRGNDDMGIESVTEGNVNFVKNYDFYINHGYSLEEAEKLFEKIIEFKDERYLIPGNLMREAERRLETLAFPQITYDTTIAHMNQRVKSGMTGYVQDDELGIKVKSKVVRIIKYKDRENSEVELNYLIPGIGDLQDINEGSSGGTKTAITQVDRQFNSSIERYEVLFQLSITNFAAAHLGVGFWLQTETTIPGTLLDGYFDIDGLQTGHIVKQSLNGFDSHGFSFKLPAIAEGSHILRFMVKSESGVFTVQNKMGELYVESESLAGGTSTRAPYINEAEYVELPPTMYVRDEVQLILGPPIE